MSDYSAVAPPPQQNFNQSSAFAAALQRAKQVRNRPKQQRPDRLVSSHNKQNLTTVSHLLQIAAKINPNSTNPNDNRQKRPLEDGPGMWG